MIKVDEEKLKKLINNLICPDDCDLEDCELGDDGMCQKSCYDCWLAALGGAPCLEH